MRRTLALSAALLVLLGAFAGCNPAADDDERAPAEQIDPDELEGNLEVWGFGTDDLIGKVRVDEFKKEFPNVTVELTPGDFDPQKFLSAVASGEPPDLIYIPRTQIGSFAARGALEPIDDFIESSGLDTGVYYEAAFQPMEFDGQTYGLPEFNNTVVAIMNNKALNQAGISPDEVDFSDWDALRDITESLSQVQGNRVVRVGFDPKIPDFFPLWAQANGGNVLSEDGTESTMDSPEVAEAVEYAASLYDAYGGREKYLAFSQTWDFFGEANPVARDQIGITLFEQWYVDVLAEVSPDVQITVRPFTTHDGGEEISYVGGNAWAIPKGSDDAQAAFAYMRFLGDAETWVAAAEAEKRATEKEGGIWLGTFTGNRDADQIIFNDIYEPVGNESFDEAIRLVLQLQETAFALPANPAGAEVEQAYTDAVNKVLAGSATAEEALQQADQEAQQALDEATES